MPRINQSFSHRHNSVPNIGFDRLFTFITRNPTYNKILNYFDENVRGMYFIEYLSSVLNVSKGQLSLAIFIALFLLITFGPATEIIFKFVALVYPAFRSYKILLQHYAIPDDQDFPFSASVVNPGASGSNANPEQIRSYNELIFWLKYWTVLALTGFIWYFLHPITWFIPFLSLFRIVFVVFLYHPSIKGANAVYTLFVSSNLIKYQNIVDFIVGFFDNVMQFSYNRPNNSANRMNPNAD